MTPHVILSVDDEVDVEELLSSHFRKEIKQGKYQFLFAHNGKDALQILRTHPEIDVVLADINMPVMDGLAMLEAIMRENYIGQPFQFVKTIIVTAYGDMPNIRKSMNYGAFDFLMKPLDLADLETTIQRALQEAGRLRELEQQRLATEKKLDNVNFLLDHGLGGVV